MKRFLLWCAAILAVLAIAGAIGFRVWFYSFLQSEDCRQWLNRTLGAALHAKGELMPVNATTGALYSDGFAARDGEVFQSLRADQIRAEVRFGFWARTCTVDHLAMARLRLDFRGQPPAKGAKGFQPVTPPDASTMVQTHSKPSRFTLREITADDLQLLWSAGALKGTRLTAAPNDGVPGEWLLTGRNGTLQLANLSGNGVTGPSDWRIESLDARIHGQTLFLTSAQLRTSDRGELRLEGELMPDQPEAARGHATFSGLSVAPWLPEDWRARLSGSFSGQLELRAEPGGGVKSEGSLALLDGELTALPVLDEIAKVTHTDGFRRMRIQKANADLVHSGDEWTVSKLTAESEGLMKVEGAFSIKGRRIAGALQVGVAPAALEWIPGAKERVFTVSRDGYLWAPVRLSGPAEHPEEDLSSRLAAAAAVQAASDVRKSVHDSAKSVIDLVAPLLPEGLPVPALPKLLP